MNPRKLFNKHWLSNVFSALLVTLFVSFPIALSQANEPHKIPLGYLVIANKSVKETALTGRNLAEIYALQMRNWQTGEKIKAFTYNNEHQDFKIFCLSGLKLQPHQLQRLWSRLQFTGVGKPPIKVKNAQEMVNRVRKTRGAIGYIKNNSQLDLKDLNVIKVEK